MKRVISTLLFVFVVAALVWLLFPDRRQNTEYGVYQPNEKLQNAEPLITDLPTIAEIDSIIKSDYKGQAITSLYVENVGEIATVFINKGDSDQLSPINIEQFILPYYEVLDVVVMPKRVEWRVFAGIPYYRIDNGYEAENVNASTIKAEPFILTNELIKLYVEQNYGVNAQYSVERSGAVVTVNGSGEGGEFAFMINALTFIVKEL